MLPPTDQAQAMISLLVVDLLVHFDIPLADEATWRLSIGGRVANPISLDLDDIRSLPRVTVPVTMPDAACPSRTNGRRR